MSATQRELGAQTWIARATNSKVARRLWAPGNEDLRSWRSEAQQRRLPRARALEGERARGGGSGGARAARGGGKGAGGAARKNAPLPARRRVVLVVLSLSRRRRRVVLVAPSVARCAVHVMHCGGQRGVGAREGAARRGDVSPDRSSEGDGREAPHGWNWRGRSGTARRPDEAPRSRWRAVAASNKPACETEAAR